MFILSEKKIVNVDDKNSVTVEYCWFITNNSQQTVSDHLSK